MITVKQPIIVDKHPFSKIRFSIPLHFHMNQHPRLATCVRVNLDEFVRIASPHFRIAHDLLQLVIQKFNGMRPVNLRMNLRKQQRKKFGKVMLQRFFPGTVVIIAKEISRIHRESPEAVGNSECGQQRSSHQLAGFTEVVSCKESQEMRRGPGA